MTLIESSRLNFTNDINICCILNGIWQVSGSHGRISPKVAIQSMFNYMDGGFTTWDWADNCGLAEDFIGEFRRQLININSRGIEASSNLQALTKWMPIPIKMTIKLVDKNIDISRKRMNLYALDLVQFHWWEYQNKNYLDALNYMAELQSEGKIKHLALTNFDTEHLKIIIESGIKTVSHQIQFSLVVSSPFGRNDTVFSEA